MMKYKFVDPEHTAVINLETGTSNIHPGHWVWQQYQEWVDAGGVTEPFQTEDEKFQVSLATAEENARETFQAALDAPVEVNGVLWNGGAESASKIQGAVTLAQALGEKSVKIFDFENTFHDMTADEAMALAVLIAKSYRDALFAKQEALIALKSK